MIYEQVNSLRLDCPPHLDKQSNIRSRTRNSRSGKTDFYKKSHTFSCDPIANISMDAAMQTTMNRSALSIAVWFALFGASSVALAQVEADKPKVDAKPVPKVEVISVVAENPRGYRASIVQVGAFRDQNILEVPLTVNVIPRAVPDSQDSRGVYDALRNTGGVSRAQLSGAIYDNLSIRGVALQNRTNYRLNGSLPIINLIDMPM
ncbi:MAG: hypothetical protein LW838_06380, partial [Nitrosomonadaceae bacterium]|nr:hypothetical protein [Nitrosomonadaceae bacterium]